MSKIIKEVSSLRVWLALNCLSFFWPIFFSESQWWILPYTGTLILINFPISIIVYGITALAIDYQPIKYLIDLLGKNSYLIDFFLFPIFGYLQWFVLVPKILNSFKNRRSKNIN